MRTSYPRSRPSLIACLTVVLAVTLTACSAPAKNTGGKTAREETTTPAVGQEFLLLDRSNTRLLEAAVEDFLGGLDRAYFDRSLEFAGYDVDPGQASYRGVMVLTGFEDPERPPADFDEFIAGASELDAASVENYTPLGTEGTESWRVAFREQEPQGEVAAYQFIWVGDAVDDGTAPHLVVRLTYGLGNGGDRFADKQVIDFANEVLRVITTTPASEQAEPKVVTPKVGSWFVHLDESRIDVLELPAARFLGGLDVMEWDDAVTEGSAVYGTKIDDARVTVTVMTRRGSDGDIPSFEEYVARQSGEGLSLIKPDDFAELPDAGPWRLALVDTPSWNDFKQYEFAWVGEDDDPRLRPMVWIKLRYFDAKKFERSGTPPFTETEAISFANEVLTVLTSRQGG